MIKYVVSYVDIGVDCKFKPYVLHKLFDSYDDAMQALLEDAKECLSDFNVFDKNMLVATLSKNNYIIWNINEVEVSD